MSSSRDKLGREIDEVLVRFRNDRFLLIQALMQLNDREKILAMNRLRIKYGEKPITPEPTMYEKGTEKLEWIIDVPKHWTGVEL